jgi:hypothetical protein
MNQQRLQAYLNLIQELLTCSEGEEWTLLQQHEELVNPELVQVMEQVASQLTTEGNREAAEFLHHWANQIKHILTQTTKPEGKDDRYQAYLNLIQALLDCPKGAEEGILAANQQLVNPTLIGLMKQLATQVAAEGNRETAHYLNNLAAQLSRTLMPAKVFKTSPTQELNRPKFDPNEYKQRLAQLQERLAQPQAESESIPTPPVTAPPIPPAESAISPSFSEQLNAIAESLTKLEEMLASRLQPPDPLWYMNILERAQTANWILTTEEVEQLIGVKPRCETGKDSYQRGCWTFLKVGKMGAQTGWRVIKEEEL